MSTSQVPTLTKRVSQLARQVKYSLIAFALVNVCILRAVAQDVHSHSTTTPNELTADQQSNPSTLLRVVREATERFKDVRHAEHEGYRLEFGCVSGDDFGAMGLHYVNDTLVGNGIVDVTRPQIVLYEAQPDGSLKLTGADYLVIASAWDEKHPGTHRSSWDRSFTTSNPRIASDCQPSTRCMCGRGRRIPRARS
jgi:hypothetical protein